MGRNWSQEEVEEILRRAIARQQLADAQREGTSHEDLLSAAREVGIDPAAVDAAAKDLAKEREGAPTKALAPRPGKWARFLRSFASYAIVNAFLFMIDAATGPGWWAHWVAIGWGIGLAFQAMRIFFPDEEEEARREKKRAQREERRARRRAQREARRETEKEFEEAVEAGVNALLGIAAKKIRLAIEDRPKVRVEVEDDSVEAEGEGGREGRRAR